MIVYICDGNHDHIIKKQQYEKNEVDGKHYCNQCFPKVKNIVRNLRPQLTIRINADKEWYETEKESQIQAACDPS
jgi:hypothetical protein